MNETQLTNHEKILFDMEHFHPRAMKLLRKQKPFIVIAIDEPYFMKAYNMIRINELGKGTWTEQDEIFFNKLAKDFDKIECRDKQESEKS